MASTTAASTDESNDRYGILSSIRMVREMVEQEFSQHGRKASSSSAGATTDGSSRQQQGDNAGGNTDTMSQIYRLKQRHYKESKQWKEKIRVQKDEIRHLKQRLLESENEAKRECELRTTMETTLEAQANNTQTLESQLQVSWKERSEMKEHAETLLATLDEQNHSISKEREASEKLVAALRHQKRDAEKKMGIEEAGRLRAEARRDEFQTKLELLQKQLDEEKSKVQELQVKHKGDSSSIDVSSSSSSGLLSSADALKALEIVMKEKNILKEELGQIKSKNQQKLTEIEKANIELRRQLEYAKSSSSKATASSGGATTSKRVADELKLKQKLSQIEETSGETASLETALSKASTLVASLQSQVDVMEKAVDGDDNKSKASTAKQGAGLTSATAAAVSGAVTTTTITTNKSNAAPATAKTNAATRDSKANSASGKRPNTSAGGGGPGGTGGKKNAKKQKVASKKQS